METVLKGMSCDSRDAAIKYMAAKQVPQLFESLTAGLLHHRPEHPVEFVQDCLDAMRENQAMVRWNSFIEWTPPPGSRTASRASSAQPGPRKQDDNSSTSTHLGQLAR